jgi:hypothetical protein
MICGPKISPTAAPDDDASEVDPAIGGDDLVAPTGGIVYVGFHLFSGLHDLLVVHLFVLLFV